MAVAAVGEAVRLESLATSWRTALDVAQSALAAAHGTLVERELGERARRLGLERAETVRALDDLARVYGSVARFGWIAAPTTDIRRLLGLPPELTACVFNLDGVLIGSAAVHAGAWREVFDGFLAGRADPTGGTFAPFDPVGDYYRYIHARPRLDGVREFLAHRGIRLAEGGPGDTVDSQTVHGLAKRKQAVLLRRVEEHPLAAYGGARQYLELAREAGVRRAIVSASAHARTMVERAGLADLVDAYVDGDAMLAEQLRRKPAPDTLLAACRRLDVEPAGAAAFETTRAGVAAARAAGFACVIAVDRHAPEALVRAGADAAVTGLAELLRPALAA